MFLTNQTSLKISLLIFSAFVFQTTTVTAGEGDSKLQPVPESQPVNSYCPDCQNGQSNMGACPNCQNGMTVDGRGYGFCNHCNRRGRMSPGTGWCAPSKVIIQRQRVQYYKYYPNYWSGYGPGAPLPYAPMVHTPTDTTQLGFYYQHTPTWTVQPWRIPGPAHPAAWHNRFCGRYNHRRSQPRRVHYNYAGYQQGAYCPTCQPNAAGSTPAEKSGKELGPQPVELPEPEASINVPKFSVLPGVPPEV